jgi:hypothetical protein
MTGRPRCKSSSPICLLYLSSHILAHVSFSHFSLSPAHLRRSSSGKAPTRPLSPAQLIVGDPLCAAAAPDACRYCPHSMHHVRPASSVACAAHIKQQEREATLTASLADPPIRPWPAKLPPVYMQVCFEKSRATETLSARDPQRKLGVAPSRTSRPKLVGVPGRNRARPPSHARRWQDGSFSTRFSCFRAALATDLLSLAGSSLAPRHACYHGRLATVGGRYAPRAGQIGAARRRILG